MPDEETIVWDALKTLYLKWILQSIFVDQEIRFKKRKALFTIWCNISQNVPWNCWSALSHCKKTGITKETKDSSATPVTINCFSLRSAGLWSRSKMKFFLDSDAHDTQRIEYVLDLWLCKQSWLSSWRNRIGLMSGAIHTGWVPALKNNVF